MKKLLTLLLATAALNARAQITLDGIISANEIGTGGGKYMSLGQFTTPHSASAGFGLAGLLQLYGANSGTRLYVGIAGTLEASGNNFQLYMDLPNKTGVPVGTALPSIAGTSTVFGTFGAHGIGGTKLELEADAAIATTGQGDVQAAVYSNATTAVARSLGGGAAILTDGTSNPLYDTSGAYALFNNTMVAYKAPTGNITTNPGNSNGGGAGSYALEYGFDRSALGLPSGASIVRVMAAYVSGDAYWSSDVIPEIPGNGNTNLAYNPDFTTLPGVQAAAISLVVLSTRQADEAVVAMSVFPNPAAGSATVAYQVQGAPQDVSVRVLDLLGREVRTLLAARQSPGFHDLSAPTEGLAPGAYLVRVQVGDKVATRQLAVTR